MILAVLSLLAGMWGGVVRMNVHIPAVSPNLFLFHGALMVSGFLGMLILLERAAALGYIWTYLGPLLSGLGCLALAFGIKQFYCSLLITIASVILIIIFMVVFRLQPSLASAIMWLGALSWFTGNFLWLNGGSIPYVVHWWGGFLVLTIAGERLELARLQKGNVAFFLVGVLLLIGGLISAIFYLGIGVRIAGAGYLTLALWLFINDIARHTVKQDGLPRFIALGILLGYLWLGVSAGAALVFGGVESGTRYDIILHSLFLGFVFSMIFGHAPIIFPAVLGVNMKFRKTFYAHLILLHLSLLLRIAGDLISVVSVRQIGGVLNVLAIIVFFANTIYSVLNK